MSKVIWLEMNRNMQNILAPRAEAKSRDELIKEWAPKPIDYEGGIDYEPAGPVSGAEGLSVVEFEERP